MWKEESEATMTLPFLAYMLGCLAVGFVLTIIVSLFRSTKNDNFKSGWFIACFAVLAGLAPYGYHEFLTRKWAPLFEKTAKSVVSQAKVAGKMSYMRVVAADEFQAKILVVCSEKGQFGEPERTVMEVLLKNTNGKWHATTYSFVNSFKRQKDGSTLPPYW